jgi:type IV secretory pathway VirJ component
MSSVGGRMMWATMAWCVAMAAHPALAQKVETLTVPTFGTVTIYQGSKPPREVVLFISGDGGWNLGVVPMAERLRDLGALVVGIDIRSFMKSMEASTACAYPGGSLEELARSIELRYKLPAYKPPILVGYSSGATLVYAALAGSPPEAFAGAVSLGFCPDLELHRPLCQQRGLKSTPRAKGPGVDLAQYSRLVQPWMVLQGDQDQVCAPEATRTFVAGIPTARLFWLPKVGHGFGVTRNWESQFIEAFKGVAAARARDDPPPAAAAEVRDLSLVEVPASNQTGGDSLAIILTGDGGWAELDRSVAQNLAARGVPAVGWSSLRYYWTPRTPEQAAADLDRIIQHYTTAWARGRVILIGYSFGADVLPFLVNRLPAPTRARVEAVALLGLSEHASFEFHVSSWLGGNRGDHPTVPEVARMNVTTRCIRGIDEDDSGCLRLDSRKVSQREVGRGHHFSGDYARLVDAILGRP